MTISTDLARVTHVADGVNSFFSSSPIEALTNANTVVTLTTQAGVVTTLTVGADYVLTPTGVVLNNVPAAGIVVAIQRVEALVQPDRFRTNAPFPAQVLEARLDKIVAGLQQLRDEVERALRATPADAAVGNLPPVQARAGRLLGFDGNGNPIATQGGSLGNFVLSSFSDSLLPLADAPTWRAALAALSAADAAALITTNNANVVLRDGSNAMTGAFNGGNFRLTNIGAATNATDAARLEQIGHWLRDNRVLIREERADGTDNGATTAGSWQDRGVPLVEALDTGSLASVSGSTFTLAPGTWDFRIEHVFGTQSGGARGRLFDVTAGAPVPNGISTSATHGSPAGANTNWRVPAIFRLTLAATTTFRLQYRVQNALTPGGLGWHDQMPEGNEVFSTIDAIRVAT